MTIRTQVSKLFLLVSILTLLSATSGCATLFAGGPDQVPVMTNPPGAYVYLNGQAVGQTPMMLSLDHNMPANIQIYLPGYLPVVMAKYKTFSGWFIVSVIFFEFFLIPPIVDLVTGNINHYDNTGIAIGLTPSQGPPPAWYQQQQQQPQPPPYQPPPPPGPSPIQPGGGPQR